MTTQLRFVFNRNLRDYLELFRNYKNILLFGVLGAFFSGYGQTYLLSLFVPKFLDSFALTKTSFGAIYSGATLFAAFVLFHFGKKIDHWSLRKFFVIVSVGLCIATIALGLASNTYLFFVAIVLVRLFGQGLMSHASITSISRFFNRNRGKALGIAMLGFPLSEAILPISVASLMMATDWRTTLIIMGVFVLVAVLPFGAWLVSDEKGIGQGEALPETPNVSPIMVDLPNVMERSRADLLRDFRFYLLLPSLVAPPFLITGFFVYQVPLAETKGWSLAWLATSFVAYSITRASASLFIGPLVDRFSAARLLPFSLVPLLLGIASLSIIEGRALALVYLGLCGLSIGAGGNIKAAFLVEFCGVRHLGSIRSMMGTIAVVSTSVSPLLFGRILDAGLGFSFLSVTSTIYIGISILLCWAICQSVIRESKQSF